MSGQIPTSLLRSHDRGDEFLDHFADRYSDLPAEQEAGISAFYVLAAEGGSVLGRFNLYDCKDGTAELGYRVAQHVTGRGVSTAAVRELCRLAAARHGLRVLRAATAPATRRPRGYWPGRVRPGRPR